MVRSAEELFAIAKIRHPRHKQQEDCDHAWLAEVDEAVAAEAAHGRRDGLLTQGVFSSNSQTTRIHRTAVLVLLLTHGARADNTQTMKNPS